MAAWWPRRQSEIPVDPLARDDRSRLPGSMPSRPDKYDIAPRPGSVRSGRTPARHLCKTCGVGSTVMFRVRYVVAVLVGLAVGAAAGWMSGRGFGAWPPGGDAPGTGRPCPGAGTGAAAPLGWRPTSPATSAKARRSGAATGAATDNAVSV